MDPSFVAVRTVHFAACILLGGELLFASLIVDRAGLSENPGRGTGGFRRHLLVTTSCATPIAAASLVAWLVIEAAAMSGTSLSAVLGHDTLRVVVRETSFGHVFVVRMLVLAALGLALAGLALARAPRRRRAFEIVALILALVELGALAFVGHASASGDGAIRAMHVGADALHLLAAGAWLGALPALAYCLGQRDSVDRLARTTRRFSLLGVTCVIALIASGIVNTLLLVGSVPRLIGTTYGHALLVKLAVFVVLLGLAAVNRLRLTPRLGQDDRRAAILLRRNAIGEIVGGFTIVAIVGALGAMVPAAHSTVDWPLPFTLDVSHGGLRIVRAFPTTYVTSPIPYTVKAVRAGEDRYREHCASCHGGSGEPGRDAGGRVDDLVERVWHDPPGNLYWAIAHGVPGTTMEAFSPTLSDTAIWQIVQFLTARADARAARSIGARVDEQSTVRVPDFSVEIAGTQHTLLGERTPALVVLYSRLGELDQLANDHALMHAPLRVIPVPLSSGAVGDAARVSPDVGAVYAMFAHRPDGGASSHAELLIDDSGTLRARWLGLPSPGGEDILAAVAAIPARGPSQATAHHGH